MTEAVARGRAGGKVILLGEHAVVHGVPALALGLERGVTVEARASVDGVRLEVPRWGLDVAAGDGSPGGEALAALTGSLGLGERGASLRGDPDLPARSGLGSSASLAAAAARALLVLSGREASPDQLFEAVQASERVFHGNPSGIDARLVLEGGVVSFSRERGARRLEVNIPGLVVVNTGRPGDTGQMVARFASRLESAGAAGRERLARVAGLVDDGREALERGDLGTLGRAMDANHEELAWFGVSTSELDRACEAARRAGALGAKLTGGGGGGCAVALVRPGDEELEQRLAAAGLEVIGWQSA